MFPRGLACVLVAGCTPSSSEPAIARVEPPAGPTSANTPIRIEGSGFRLAISSDLDRGTHLLGDVIVDVGPARLTEARWRGETLIEAVVPAGVEVGPHDVAVTIGASSSVLERGFTVTSDEPDPLEPLGPFGTPTVIGPLSSPDTDDDPSMTADHLEVFFNSNRAGGPGQGDIWVATRATVSDPWQPPVLVAGINSPMVETTPEISPDGLTLYFASDRPGGLGGTDLWMTTRAARTSPWSVPVHVPELGSPANESGSMRDPSELVVIFASGRSGDADLYVAKRASTSDPWGTPGSLAEVNTTDGESDPTLVALGRALVFTSNRPNGTGSNDLYLAERTDAALPFGPQIELVELNSTGPEEDPWLADDRRYIMFASNRNGNWEIYEASR